MKFSIFIFDNFFSYRYGKIILGDRQMPISRWLSPRVIFPYLYEKKLPNMKIENFKKSQKFYKKIKTNSHWNISRPFSFSPRNVPETSNRQKATSYSGRASYIYSIISKLSGMIWFEEICWCPEASPSGYFGKKMRHFFWWPPGARDLPVPP